MTSNYTSSIKLHLIIMIVLYGGTWFILNNFVMQQQQKMLKEYREIRAKLEYDYMRLRESPEYVQTIQKTINYAKEKINGFIWLNSDYDPNLLFFQHISSLAEKAGVQIVSIQPVDRNNEKYYFWNVALKGSFSDILHLIKNIESSQKFLKIESAEITNAEDGLEITIKISGINKLE